MNNREIARQLQSLRDLIKRTSQACGGDVEMQAHWARYLCVLSAGLVENAQAGEQALHLRLGRQEVARTFDRAPVVGGDERDRAARRQAGAARDDRVFGQFFEFAIQVTQALIGGLFARQRLAVLDPVGGDAEVVAALQRIEKAIGAGAADQDQVRVPQRVPGREARIPRLQFRAHLGEHPRQRQHAVHLARRNEMKRRFVIVEVNAGKVRLQILPRAAEVVGENVAFEK